MESGGAFSMVDRATCRGRPPFGGSSDPGSNFVYIPLIMPATWPEAVSWARSGELRNVIRSKNWGPW